MTRLNTICSLFPAEIDAILCSGGLQLLLWATVTQIANNKVKSIIDIKNVNDITNIFKSPCKNH